MHHVVQTSWRRFFDYAWNVHQRNKQKTRLHYRKVLYGETRQIKISCRLWVEEARWRVFRQSSWTGCECNKPVERCRWWMDLNVCHRPTWCGNRFFEFLSYTDMMEDAGITHFKSCVPLTYLHKDLFENDEAKSAIEQLSANLPDTVMPLCGHPGRKSTESLADADEIDTPCVFNLATHKDEIDFLFHYIATHNPRKMKD